jgi:hypothetical protein
MRLKKAVYTFTFAALALLAVAKVADNVFPTKVGATWWFTGSAGANQFNPVCKISSSKKSGNKTVVVMQWTFNSQNIQTETYWVTPSEVVRVQSGAGGKTKINPPVPVIKYPLTVGKSWTWKGVITTDGTGIPGTANLRVSKMETVKSAAGTFNAYRVDMTLTLSAQGQTATIPNTYWFAPGKGMVKQSASLQGMNIEAVVTKMSGQ